PECEDAEVIELTHQPERIRYEVDRTYHVGDAGSRDDLRPAGDVRVDYQVSHQQYDVTQEGQHRRRAARLLLSADPQRAVADRIGDAQPGPACWTGAGHPLERNASGEATARPP